MSTDTSGCVNPDYSRNGNLSLHLTGQEERLIVLGEVLWDVFDHSRRLGGASLNFGVHAQRLGHQVTLISAVGKDELGELAARNIAQLGLDTRFLQTTSRFPTGTAQVHAGKDGKPQFTITRPAAYDAVQLTSNDLESLRQTRASWLYYGTLFASTASGRSVLDGLLSTLPSVTKFYDLNLRPGSDSSDLVLDLLRQATVVKLNEEELQRVCAFTGLPADPKTFCHGCMERYGWKAVAITLGDRGCAMYANGEYIESAGHAIDVVDTVGAGDAFAAAFLHGLTMNWPAPRIASFANRVGALVASRHGAIPDWTLEEAVSL